MRSRSPFCAEEWRTIPFLGRKKSMIDLLVDTITICTDLHSRVEGLKTLFFNPAKHEKERLIIQLRAEVLKVDLDEIWMELRQRAGNQGWKGGYFNDVPGFDNLDVLSRSLEKCEPVRA